MLRAARLIFPAVAAACIATAVARPAVAGPDAEQTKINTYVDMINAWSPYVVKTRRGYAAWANLEAGPTCKEPGIRAPSGIGDSAAKAFAGYAKATKQAPALAIDAAASRMATALTALIEPTTEAEAYYGKRQYRDDDCKRGKELHATLVAQWAAYLDAEHEVRAFLIARADKEAVAALDKAKKQYGAKLRYHFEKLLIDAKATVREIDDQLGAEAPDAAAIRTRLEAMQATYAAVEPMAAAKTAGKPVYDDLYQGGYVVFLRAAKGMPDSVDRLLKVLAESPARPGDARAEQAAEDRRIHAHKGVIDAYNTMIGAANRTRFSARIK